MLEYIISIELLQRYLQIHVIELQPFSRPRTTIVSLVNSPQDMKTVRVCLETNDFRTLANWLKEKFSITHCKLTISLGPEIRNYLHLINKRKEDNYENQNFNN